MEIIGLNDVRLVLNRTRICVRGVEITYKNVIMYDTGGNSSPSYAICADGNAKV